MQTVLPLYRAIRLYTKQRDRVFSRHATDRFCLWRNPCRL